MTTPHFQTSYSTALAVTPSDSADNSYMRLYVGGTGDVKVTTLDGNVVTFKAVPVGSTLCVETSLVWSTGTTATLIVGLR